MDNILLDIKFSDEGAEPVTPAEAKNWLKIDDVTDDDALIVDLITSSRMHCEGYLNISLVNRTIVAYLNIGLGEMPLPYGPVIEVTDVSSIDGVTQITSYILRYEVFKAIDPAPEIKVTYTAGFAAAIPKNFKIAILNEIAWEYEHRGDGDAGDMSPEVKRMLKPYRRVL